MTDIASLEDGYYWVRMDDEWEVAQKLGRRFYLTSDEDKWCPAAFDEIDPRPIKRDNGNNNFLCEDAIRDANIKG